MFRKLTFVLMLSAFVLNAQQVGLACRCAPPSVRTAYKRAEAIVVARVLQISGDTPGKQNVKLSISQTWKKTVPTDLTIDNSSVCPLNIEEGRNYLLFITRDQNGTLYVDRCSRNQLIEQADDSLQWLQQHASRFDVTSNSSNQRKCEGAHQST